MYSLENRETTAARMFLLSHCCGLFTGDSGLPGGGDGFAVSAACAEAAEAEVVGVEAAAAEVGGDGVAATADLDDSMAAESAANQASSSA